MLVQFSVQNFLSFKDKQVLSFESEALKEFSEHVHIPYLYEYKTSILKSIALFGYNAHGKSNLLKAYRFFVDLVLNSFGKSNAAEQIEVRPFLLNTATAEGPSTFEIIVLLRDQKFRYGFSLTENGIQSEWLFLAQTKLRENMLFVRNEQEFQLSKTWEKESAVSIDRQSKPFAKPTVLLFSVLMAQEGVAKIDPFANWLRKNVVTVNRTDRELLEIATRIFADEQYNSIIHRFLEDADLGFSTVYDKLAKLVSSAQFDPKLLQFLFSERMQGFKLYTNHKVYDEGGALVRQVEFEFLKDESEGSIKYFLISCLVAFTIKNNQLLVIDELDARLHPDLLLLLLSKFHDAKMNTTGAQMLFTNHGTAILDKHIRRDQIVMIEKNQLGESTVRKLHTRETPVRIDISIEREYRKGKLGGVSKKARANRNQTRLFGEE